MPRTPKAQISRRKRTREHPPRNHPKTDKEAFQLAKRDRKAGKTAGTQARHFVHEEMEHLKEGKRPPKNRKQAIAIGLSKARKHGIRVPSQSRTNSTKRASRKHA